jgi:beta-1,4-mannooligosaccharide/beta-1,4-mannosyl-N-acetylglucosamine phosphorylase
MLYHGVINTCNGFRYAMGAAILDKNAPDKVKYRTQPYLLGPHVNYEQVGDVPNVVFPCAALHDIKEDKLAVYYGAADTVVALAFGKLSEIIQYTKENSL